MSKGKSPCKGFAYNFDSSEENNDATGVEMARVQSLGKIQVKVTRVELLGTFDKPSSSVIKRVSELPEKMLKGRSVDNTVEYACP